MATRQEGIGGDPDTLRHFVDAKRPPAFTSAAVTRMLSQKGATWTTANFLPCCDIAPFMRVCKLSDSSPPRPACWVYRVQESLCSPASPV